MWLGWESVLDAMPEDLEAQAIELYVAAGGLSIRAIESETIPEDAVEMESVLNAVPKDLEAQEVELYVAPGDLNA